jgi:hypothetical protein
MPEPRGLRSGQVEYQQIQYAIKLALFNEGLTLQKHLDQGYLCVYGEDTIYKTEEINLDANNNTVSLYYDDNEVIGGISIWTRDYYFKTMDYRSRLGNYRYIPFAFGDKQYVLTIDADEDELRRHVLNL